MQFLLIYINDLNKKLHSFKEILIINKYFKKTKEKGFNTFIVISEDPFHSRTRFGVMPFVLLSI